MIQRIVNITRKIGIIIIIIGIFVPTFSLVFVRDYYPLTSKGISNFESFIFNLQFMKIVLREQKKEIRQEADPFLAAIKRAGPQENEPNTSSDLIIEDVASVIPGKPEIAVPYRYVLSAGVLLIFLGITSISLTKAKR